MKNLLVIGLRNILRQKTYSFINIIGLTAGITSFLLMFLYVYNDLRFDRFHKNINEIYLVCRNDKSPDGYEMSSNTPGPLPGFLKSKYGDRLDVATYQQLQVTAHANGQFNDITIAAINRDFMNMFSFKLESGNPETVLSDPFSVVITRQAAQRIYGTKNVIGKTLTVFNKYEFKITGIMGDVPVNSSLKFDALISFELMKKANPDYDQQWWNSGVNTFLRFPSGFSPDDLSGTFPQLIKNNYPDFLQGRSGLKLIAFRDFHTYKDIQTDLAPPVSSSQLYILLSIAIVILLVACFNFTNLSISRYTERIMEVGIRKVIGASRTQLVMQFLVESLMLSYTGLLAGVIMTELLLPEFDLITGKSLSVPEYSGIFFPLSLLLLGFLIGLISGFYPALLFSSFKPINAIKGILPVANPKFQPKKILLTLQYLVTAVLIISMIVTNKQVMYMKNHDLGFKPDNIISFSTYSYQVADGGTKIMTLEDMIRNSNMAGITSVSVSENVPGYYYQNRFAGKIVEAGQDNYDGLSVTSIDENFLATFGMKLTAGRNFNPNSSEDKKNGMLINEATVRKLGITDPVGKHLIFRHGEGPYVILGVIKDFNFKPLQWQITPQVYRYAGADYRQSFISVSVLPGHRQEIKDFLSRSFSKIMPGMPFNYFYVKDHYDKGYKTETQYSYLMGGFSLISVILSLLGLFGLTSVAVNRKKKEIGIRKVFGASVQRIIMLFSKGQLKRMTIACAIGCPAGWYLMERWLQHFPYKTSISWWIFIASGLTIFITAMLTMSLETVGAARKNPVDILRYE